jgi:hypothetical protein
MSPSIIIHRSKGNDLFLKAVNEPLGFARGPRSYIKIENPFGKLRDTVPLGLLSEMIMSSNVISGIFENTSCLFRNTNFFSIFTPRKHRSPTIAPIVFGKKHSAPLAAIHRTANGAV